MAKTDEENRYRFDRQMALLDVRNFISRLWRATAEICKQDHNEIFKSKLAVY